MRDFTDEPKKKYAPSKKKSNSIKNKVKQGGKGKPLEPGLKPMMRSSLGPSVDDVRTHTDSQTEDTVREHGAQAITVGKDIYFAEGKYNPTTQEGRKLLAHELTHIVQQSEDKQRAQPSAKEAVEKEADVAANILAKGEEFSIRKKSTPGTLLMKEEGNKTVPTITRHKVEIIPIPPKGNISGPDYLIAYLYNIVGGADYITLNLNISQGIGIEVTPITAMNPGDYRIQASGGMDARTVVISFSAHLKGIPKVQVSFTKGGSSYIVIFQFPSAGKKE